jgi:hypothetical protein
VQLLEKWLRGLIPVRTSSLVLVLIAVWLGFVSWLFLQDNSTNRLKDAGGMEWFWLKALIYTLFFTVVCIAIGCLFHKTRRE